MRYNHYNQSIIENKFFNVNYKFKPYNFTSNQTQYFIDKNPKYSIDNNIIQLTYHFLYYTLKIGYYGLFFLFSVGLYSSIYEKSSPNYLWRAYTYNEYQVINSIFIEEGAYLNGHGGKEVMNIITEHLFGGYINEILPHIKNSNHNLLRNNYENSFFAQQDHIFRPEKAYLNLFKTFVIFYIYNTINEHFEKSFTNAVETCASSKEDFYNIAKAIYYILDLSYIFLKYFELLHSKDQNPKKTTVYDLIISVIISMEKENLCITSITLYNLFLKAPIQDLLSILSETMVEKDSHLKYEFYGATDGNTYSVEFYDPIELPNTTDSMQSYEEL